MSNLQHFITIILLIDLCHKGTLIIELVSVSLKKKTSPFIVIMYAYELDLLKLTLATNCVGITE